MDFLKSDFYYDLPEELIAQTPLERRDASRLLVYHRQDGRVEHRHFTDIIEYLDPGDVLVLNETRVLPARLMGIRPGGGAAEVLLLKQLEDDRWEVLVKPGRKLREGACISFGDGLLSCEVESIGEGGVRVVRFMYDGVFLEILERLGRMPLPPYIHETLEDQGRYQTVYAKQSGSAAAPTAGLHFTGELLERILKKGVTIAPVLLHVGLGTFRPVQTERVSEHVMHAEYYEITDDAADVINTAKAENRRVICVGTTSVRVLESVAAENGQVTAGHGWTDIFITPGYRFKAVDKLITNFHLPESTLLMLVSALMGRERALEAYEEAVREQYRFFSFGDAMFIV